MNKFKLFCLNTIVLLLLSFVYFVTYTFVEPKAYDFLTKTVLTKKLPFDNTKNIYGHDDIVLVVIDAKTIEKYRWPWKRELNCKIFEYFLEYAHPKVLVHDSMVANLDQDNPESDKKFFNTLKKFDNLVVGFIPMIKNWDNPDDGKKYDNVFINKFSVNLKNEKKQLPYLYSSVIKYPKPYFDVIQNVGSVGITPGFIDGDLLYSIDEVYRTQEYVINYKDNFFTSLAMQTYLLANNSPEIIVTNNSIEIPSLNRSIRQKTTKYQMITPIRYYELYNNGYSHIKYSAVDIMDSYDNIASGKKPIIDPQIFKDKIVVIGANIPASASLNDNKNSPVSVNHPGVDIQATAIDNLMHNEFLNIIPKWVNILIAVFGVMFVYFIVRKYNHIKAISLILLYILSYMTICLACYYNAVVINVTTPIVIPIITMIAAYIHKYVIEERNKQKVEKAMGKYMSEDVMKKVIQNIDNLGLGGKRAAVTVLFSDIRGFTSMSEKMSAPQVSELLNEYFSAMEPIVTKYNGIINKFIGDAIMAVFGEPIQDENHPINAVKCGYEMLQTVQEFHKKWANEGKPLLEIGVGINTGEVFVGNIGSEKRMEYTVIGDTVNLASRLESYNKTFNTKILISSSTFEACKEEVEANKISDVEIRGKSHKLDVYEVKSLLSK